jgi:peptidylprolyl isomerase
MKPSVLIITALLCLAASCSRGTTWTTRTGIKITEVKQGHGELAERGDIMSILYKASFVGGKTFDTQLDPDSPYRFRVGIGDMMPGLEEGIRTMRPGGKRIVVVPPELAYGKEGLKGTVPPDTWVRFEVELVSIEPMPPCPEEWNEAGKDIFTTPSGLQIVDFVIGKGEMPTKDSVVRVMYSAFLDDGSCFDSSYRTGVPVRIELAKHELIPGWYEGLLSMREGGQRKLIIPPFLGYGDKGFRGVVPPNATLTYDIELLEIE